MKEYLLSICIPTYNRSFFLKGLIENILVEIARGNHGRDVQIVIVDGNSSDNTSEIINEIANRSQLRSELKYFRREKKEGIDKDILKCIELSDGKYCWLFSDDDRFSRGAISHLINKLRTNDDITGCFCNRISYDFQMKRAVNEVKGWPNRIIKKDYLFTDKAECFKYIGMDFGFISSQVVRKTAWQKAAEGKDFGNLYNSYYLMVHIIGRMMDEKFKWLLIDRPLVNQRTGNDSLLQNKGILQRQTIEHNSFENIVAQHYDSKSKEHKLFFRKMVSRLPRVVANLKSQNIDWGTQLKLFKLFFDKYKHYPIFWIKVIPVFIFPNSIFKIIKKVYFSYWIRSTDSRREAVV